MSTEINTKLKLIHALSSQWPYTILMCTIRTVRVKNRYQKLHTEIILEIMCYQYTHSDVAGM